MPIHTFSSRDFTRDVSAAKRAASGHPVFITDRGRPAFVLLNIDYYYSITEKGEKTFLETMDSIAGGNFEFEPPRLDLQTHTIDFD